MMEKKGQRTRRFSRHGNDARSSLERRSLKSRNASNPASWVRKTLPALGTCQIGFLDEAACCTKEGDPKLQGGRSCRSGARRASMAGERGKKPEGWEQLHLGGADGFIGSMSHVMTAQLLQKHLEWQDRKKDVWQGSERRPTVYIVSMDIKTPPDVARPKHIADFLVGQDAHGWTTAALLRRKKSLEGQATFEHSIKSALGSPHASASLEAPTLWLKMGQSTRYGTWKDAGRRERDGVHLDEHGRGSHEMCSILWADNYWVTSHLKQMMTQLIEEA